MAEFIAEFQIERETKNTVRYNEIVENQPAKIGALYIKKWILPKPYPEQVHVTVKIVE